MSRIKLPGKESNKKILLLVLVLIAILIIGYEGIENLKNQKIKNEDNKQSEEEIIMPMNESKEILKEDNQTNLNLEKAVSERETDLYNEAYTLFFSNEYQNAIAKADELIDEFPQNAMGYNIRGIAKAYNGDYNGGMQDIDKSLDLDDNYWYARFNKALTYELYENMDEALVWYNKSLESEEYAWSYYGIASIYGRRGDIENTMIYLNKAIYMDKSVKNFAKTEHDFDPVRNSKEFKEAIYN